MPKLGFCTCSNKQNSAIKNKRDISKILNYSSYQLYHKLNYFWFRNTRKNMKKYRIIAGIVIVANIILIYTSGLDKGKGSFYSIPFLMLIDLAFIIYSIVKNNRRLIQVSIILFFVSLFSAIVVFIRTFPFLTR